MATTLKKPYLNLIQESEKSLTEAFEQIDTVALSNQRRVLQAFKNNRLSEEHFAEYTGYGLHDPGRAVIDKIFADVMQAERAAVRLQFVSGTHTIACALFGNLRSGDRMISLTGRPYDTLLPVIGLTGNSPQSLVNSGVLYDELSFEDTIRLSENSNPDQNLLNKLSALLKAPTKLIHIQKSRGYSVERYSITNEQIAKLCQLVRTLNKDIIIMVDNCYGEFTETEEPTALGADIIVGSLIKNPGGGLAVCGGYIAGKTNLVEQALTRLTAPGIKGELGLLYNQNRLLLQGLFIAPSTVASAIKGAMLTACVLERLGYKVHPKPLTKRCDIVQTVEFGNKEDQIRFCQAVQAASPVDAYVIPEPAPMPGYSDDVIMAAGTFIQGATIELSADGPIRPPYVAYIQGGLTYLHSKCMLENVIEYLN